MSRLAAGQHEVQRALEHQEGDRGTHTHHHRPRRGPAARYRDHLSVRLDDRLDDQRVAHDNDEEGNDAETGGRQPREDVIREELVLRLAVAQQFPVFVVRVSTRPEYVQVLFEHNTNYNDDDDDDDDNDNTNNNNNDNNNIIKPIKQQLKYH